jgi:TPR repeat protein
VRVRGLVLAFALGSVGCAPAQLTLVAAPPAAAGCPIDGCEANASRARPEAAPLAACASAGDAPCGGASARQCAEDALGAWADAQDDRAVACVARKLIEACTLDDARACGFAGRMLLDGRGLPRDARRGLGMVARACDGGFALACLAGIRSLGDPRSAGDVSDPPALRARLELEHACLTGQGDACYQVGVLFYFGRDAFPRDRVNAAVAYSRGCDLGESRACNNLGDGLAYGDGVGRDAERAAAAFAKACRLGEALGCANLGYMAEQGEGMARDLPRARALYRDACTTGDVYGCLHADMLAAQDGGVPRELARALAQWRRACDRGRDARACAFVGVIYEDGPDGLARDEAKSLQAMARACQLGEPRACEWLKVHPGD